MNDCVNRSRKWIWNVDSSPVRFKMEPALLLFCNFANWRFFLFFSQSLEKLSSPKNIKEAFNKYSRQSAVFKVKVPFGDESTQASHMSERKVGLE